MFGDLQETNFEKVWSKGSKGWNIQAFNPWNGSGCKTSGSYISLDTPCLVNTHVFQTPQPQFVTHTVNYKKKKNLLHRDDSVPPEPQKTWHCSQAAKWTDLYLQRWWSVLLKQYLGISAQVHTICALIKMWPSIIVQYPSTASSTWQSNCWRRVRHPVLIGQDNRHRGTSSRLLSAGQMKW